jgi:SAM-dependent methyltransferase
MKQHQLRVAGYLRLIPDPYAIPYDDGTFDVIVSDQVFEHVMDYPGTLAELQRVMKPGGVFIHMFPSRYRVIEPHVFVPFGTIIRAPSWLRLWASLGIRNSFQKGQPAAEVARFNRNYLTTRTHYLSRRDLRRQFERYFTDVRFVEKTYLKYAGRARPLYTLSSVVWFLPALYSALHGRVVFGRRAASADRTQETLRPIEHQQRFRNAAHV